MFWENFYDLCRKEKKSPNGVAKDLGLSSGSITSWKQGKVPHHGTLIKLADYFGVTVDYLLGTNNESKTLSDEMTEEEKKMHELFQLVPKDKQEEVLKMIEAALKVAGQIKKEK